MIAARPLPPPDAVHCPKCGSVDTPKYKFPDDEVSRYHAERIDARKCMDCGDVFWR